MRGEQHIRAAKAASAIRADYPHLRGEQIKAALLSYALAGSPRVRGEQAAHVRRGGITPACAGNRGLCVCTHLSCTGSPRVRGEQKWAHMLGFGGHGSPPRMRG